MTGITDRQQEILHFINDYFAEEDQMPSYATIGKEFDIFPNAAVDITGILITKGILARNVMGKLKRGVYYYHHVPSKWERTA